MPTEFVATAAYPQKPTGIGWSDIRVWYAFVDAMRDPSVGKTARHAAIRKRMGAYGNRLTPRDITTQLKAWSE